MAVQLQQSENEASSAEVSALSSIETMEGLLESTQSVQKQAEFCEGTKTTSVTGLRRVIYLFLAGLFFVLGAAGVILPGLPTTPFLLLTSYFLMKSSPRLNALLLRSPMFGPILRDWQHRKGIRRDVKFQAIAIVTLLVVGTIYFMQPSFVISVVTCSGALIGILVISRLPELPGKAKLSTKDR